MPLVEAKGHHLSVSLPAADVRLQGDPTRLEQVVTNLLNNAAKYTEPGGKIALTAEQEGNELVIRVKDSGIGLSERMIPRVFDLFAQADISLDRTQGGLGDRADPGPQPGRAARGEHRRREPGLGHGSEFTVRLPVQEPSPGGIPTRSRPTRGRKPGACTFSSSMTTVIPR